MGAVEPIELPITANTDRFTRKLRLIAKAYADLADALETIDNEGQQPPLDPATHAHAFPYEPGTEPPLITGDCECGMTYEEYRRECEKDPWWSGTEARTITEAQAARDYATRNTTGGHVPGAAEAIVRAGEHTLPRSMLEHPED